MLFVKRKRMESKLLARLLAKDDKAAPAFPRKMRTVGRYYSGIEIKVL